MILKVLKSCKIKKNKVLIIISNNTLNNKILIKYINNALDILKNKFN